MLLPFQNRADVIIPMHGNTSTMLLLFRDRAEVIIPILESMKRDTPIPTPGLGNRCQFLPRNDSRDANSYAGIRQRTVNHIQLYNFILVQPGVCYIAFVASANISVD